MTATDDGTALLAAIREHPDEDTPRLVYADWLQEQGQDDRAEFIRVQCELHREEPGYVLDWSANVAKVHDRSANPKIRRAIDLCRAIFGEDRWSWEVCAGSLWSRGFVEHVTCDWGGWRDHGDAILAAHPVRRVTLTTVPEVSAVYRDAGGPQLARLAGVLDSPALKRLAGTDRTLAKQLCELRWPGVTFELPPDPDGGFWVPDEFARELSERLRRVPPFTAVIPGTIIHDPPA